MLNFYVLGTVEKNVLTPMQIYDIIAIKEMI